MSQELINRVEAVQQALVKQKLHAYVVLDRNNSYYLSGFPCSNSIILITRRDATFCTDSRYILKAESTIKHMDVELISQRDVSQVARMAAKKRVKRLGFEESITYAQYSKLTTDFEGVELVPAGKIIRDLRVIKSASEIRQIATNQKLTQQIFQDALGMIARGVRELEIRNHIRRSMIEHGGDEAFESIIATGPNSANPHAIARRVPVRKNSLLLFDMGFKRNFYNSDMTRTIAVGEKLSAQCREIYDVVLEAQLAALAAIRPGVAASSVDAAARKVISDAGFGDKFGHGLGHGVGLEVHEGPTLNASSKDVLQPGMVVTVEPGIYLPRVGGVRIEDLVVVTESGYKNLTPLPKKLIYVAV